MLVQWSLYYPDPAGDRVEREQAERADPRSPRYWNWAARQHLLRGQVPKARRALDRALALAPNDARTYTLRAAVALVQIRKAEARADAERAVAADPASPQAHLALSWVQQAEFDLQSGALASARRAVALDPDDPQALIRKAACCSAWGGPRKPSSCRKGSTTGAKGRLGQFDPGVPAIGPRSRRGSQPGFSRGYRPGIELGEPHLGLGWPVPAEQDRKAVEEIQKATLLEPKASLYNSYSARRITKLRTTGWRKSI